MIYSASKCNGDYRISSSNNNLPVVNLLEVTNLLVVNSLLVVTKLQTNIWIRMIYSALKCHGD